MRFFNLAKINGLCLEIARSEDENSPGHLAVPVTNNLLSSLYRNSRCEIIMYPSKSLKRRERFRKRSGDSIKGSAEIKVLVHRYPSCIAFVVDSQPGLAAAALYENSIGPVGALLFRAVARR